MNQKLAYALLKEIPFTKLIQIIKSAKTDPPQDMLEVVEIVVAAASENESSLYQDLAKLTVAVPAIFAAAAEQTPLKTIGMMPGFQAAKNLGDHVGRQALTFALNKKSLKGTKTLQFLQSIEEELRALK